LILFLVGLELILYLLIKELQASVLGRKSFGVSAVEQG
jgi:hypothetical protein